MYLAIHNNFIFGKADKLVDLCPQLLAVSISDEGKLSIRVLGQIPTIADSISYNLNEWTKEEALADFARTRMPKIVARYGVEIFSCAKI